MVAQAVVAFILGNGLSMVSKYIDRIQHHEEKQTKTDSPNLPPSQRELTPAEIDGLRKRNECENRFTDKKVYEVDGMSVGAACKQDPDRRP